MFLNFLKSRIAKREYCTGGRVEATESKDFSHISKKLGKSSIEWELKEIFS